MDAEQLLPKEGLPKDDVSSYAASATDMQFYRDGSLALSQFKAPVLLHAGNPHERLYVAAFDGTGNDKFKDPTHSTNVAKIDNQIADAAQSNGNRIVSGYLPGPGTEDSAVARVLDGAIGYTHEARVEAMYQRFIEQVQEWRRDDPQVQTRLADIGFSRGAEEAASFARLVHERGIQDPRGAVYTRDAHGNITHVEYTKPPLVEPGQVAQAVGLFDAVGTGDPVDKYDRRLPPSVISGVQIFAKDEHRGLFKSDHIIDPGLTADGRFLGMLVPGAHSDVGGGYLLNGLSTRSGNLMVDYLNALSDKPFLEKAPEYDDPQLNVVHRSTEGMLLYRVWHKIDRLQPDGFNTLEAPRHPGHAPVTGDPYNAAPRDEALSRRFDFQSIGIGPVPVAAQEQASRMPAAPIPDATIPLSMQGPAAASIDDMVNRLYQAALQHDGPAMDAAANEYLRSPAGNGWSREIQQYGQALQAPAMPQPATALQHEAAAVGMQR